MKIRLHPGIRDGLSGITFNLIDDLPVSRAKMEILNGILDCSIGATQLTCADIIEDIAIVNEPIVTGNVLVVSLKPFT